MYRIAVILSLLFCACLHLEAQPPFSDSNLPIIIIDTKGGQIVDEPKIEAEMKIINNGPGKRNHLSDTVFQYNNKIGIEFRGSSSQMFPKKPYGFETKDENGEKLEVALLGMPEEEDWTLNATYNDKTLMRDGLTYILAGRVMEYAPRVRYIELVINEDYQGIYLLIEKIKRSKNRVQIAKIGKSDNDGDALTGGYLIQIDRAPTPNIDEGWVSPFAPFKGAAQTTFFQYEYPKAKNITPQQRKYIREYVTHFENVLQSNRFNDPLEGFRKYIDEQSLMDYIIFNELTKNVDAYRLSTYFYKQRDSEGGKIKFGPVWDYNLGLGNVDYCTNGNPEGLVITDFNQVCPHDNWVVHFWWNKFLEDTTLYNDLKQRWRYLRQHQLATENILNTVDSLANLLNEAQFRNFKKWPILNQYVWPNYFVGATHDEEVAFLKDWIMRRLDYLDGVWYISTSTMQEQTSNIIHVWPNPIVKEASIDLHQPIQLQAIEVFNMNGQRMEIPVKNTGLSQYFADFDGMEEGIYILRIIAENQVFTRKIVKATSH